MEAPEVKLVKKDIVVFMDGSISERLDTILLCTGYHDIYIHIPTTGCPSNIIKLL